LPHGNRSRSARRYERDCGTYGFASWLDAGFAVIDGLFGGWSRCGVISAPLDKFNEASKPVGELAEANGRADSDIERSSVWGNPR
jgi:hypothetical protein